MPGELLASAYPTEDEIGMVFLQGSPQRSVADDDKLQAALNRCMARYASTASPKFFSGATRPT